MLEFIPILIGLILLLLMKGFFSGSEIALVSCDKLKLKTMAERGDRRAALVLRLFGQPESLLATTLIGTNVATMTLTVVGTAIAIGLLGPGGDLYAILLLTPLMLIFGEIVPKSIFQQQADTMAPRVAPALAVLRLLLMPVVMVLGWVGRRISRIVAPAAPLSSPFVVRRKLRMMLDGAGTDYSKEATVLDRDRIRRAIRLSDMTVGEAMVPLAHVTGAPNTSSWSELMALGRKVGHRRIPLFEGNLSNIVGIAMWTEWDELSPEFSSGDVGEATIEPHFASTIARLDDLLPILLGRVDHMAVAVDEFGSAAGIVTVEDLMSILLGSAARGAHIGPRGWEHQSNIEKLDNEVFEMDAQTRLVEIAELFDIVLPSHEFHTVGGFITSRLRRIPALGDSLEEFGYRFTITDATSRAAMRVRIEQAGERTSQ